MGVKQKRQAIGVRTVVITQCSNKNHDVRIHLKQELGLRHQGQIYGADKKQQVLEARTEGGGIQVGRTWRVDRGQQGYCSGAQNGVTEQSGGG